MRATTKDLRLHTAEVLAAADRGEEVIITYRGRERASLTGIGSRKPKSSGRSRNPGFGIWSDRDEDVNEQVRRLRSRRAMP